MKYLVNNIEVSKDVFLKVLHADIDELASMRNGPGVGEIFKDTVDSLIIDRYILLNKNEYKIKTK